MLDGGVPSSITILIISLSLGLLRSKIYNSGGFIQFLLLAPQDNKKHELEIHYLLWPLMKRASSLSCLLTVLLLVLQALNLMFGEVSLHPDLVYLPPFWLLQVFQLSLYFLALGLFL